jgi:outer membrane protein TolC
MGGVVPFRIGVLALLLAVLLDAAETAPSAPMLLAEALRLAHTQGRDKQFQNEELQLIRMSLDKTQGDYGPIFSSSLNSDLYGTGSKDQPGNRQGAQVGVRQSLPGGGTVTATTGANRTAPPGSDPATSGSTATVNLTQPLLRGAGLQAWREPLTAAERSVRYSLRAHRRFVQQLSLDVARRYWALQDRQFSVLQEQRALEAAEWSVGLAKANLELGRANATALDVFRAETQVIQTSQRLVDSKAAFAAELDAFKVDLALPVDQPMAIEATRPVAVLVDVDTAQVIATALAERSDLATARDNIEDADRALDRARRDLLPQLDALGSTSWNGTFDGQRNEAYGGAPAWSVGLRLEIPLDQRQENLSYESALIRRRQVARQAELKRSQVIQEIQASLQTLRSLEATLAIQDRNRTQARLKVEKSLLDQRAGEAGNRDVVEAQEQLTQAENAWFQAQAAYRAAELSLRHTAGVLVVAEDGAWSETPPPYATLRRAAVPPKPPVKAP